MEQRSGGRGGQLAWARGGDGLATRAQQRGGGGGWEGGPGIGVGGAAYKPAHHHRETLGTHTAHGRLEVGGVAFLRRHCVPCRLSGQPYAGIGGYDAHAMDLLGTPPSTSPAHALSPYLPYTSGFSSHASSGFRKFSTAKTVYSEAVKAPAMTCHSAQASTDCRRSQQRQHQPSLHVKQLQQWSAGWGVHARSRHHL